MPRTSFAANLSEQQQTNRREPDFFHPAWLPYTVATTHQQNRSFIMDNTQSSAGKCPVMHGAMTSSGQTNTDWWPNALNLDILH
ncbi:hypothetical protein Q4563_18510, partial [Gilvimarinus sp. 1_MG-2023]